MCRALLLYGEWSGKPSRRQRRCPLQSIRSVSLSVKCLGLALAASQLEVSLHIYNEERERPEFPEMEFLEAPTI